MKYARTGPSSCHLNLLDSEGKTLEVLAIDEDAPRSLETVEFDLRPFHGQEIEVVLRGGSVALDFMYVEQFGRSR